MNRGCTRQRARAEFPLQIRNGLNRLRSHLSTASYDIFCYRTHGEMSYLVALNGISTNIAKEWSDMEFVAQGAWIWLKVQVRVDFR